MEDKYKIINRELVIKNQNLRETIHSLTSEITMLREERFEITRNNRKLLREIDKNKIFKKKLLSYTSGISQYLTKIIQLIDPKLSFNGMNDTSIMNDNHNDNNDYDDNNEIDDLMNGSNNSDLTNGNVLQMNNTSPGVNKGSELKSIESNNSNEEISQTTFVNTRRRKRSSIRSSVSFTNNSSDFNGIVPSPRKSNGHSHIVSEAINDTVEETENSAEVNDASVQLSQEQHMTTIIEESQSTTQNNTIKSHPILDSKTQESVSLNNQSRTLIPEINVIQPINEDESSMVTESHIIPEVSVIQPITNDVAPISDMTISNVPCSTPFHKKNSLAAAARNDDEDDDDHYKNSLSRLKIKEPRILLKRLKPKSLSKFNIDIESDNESKTDLQQEKMGKSRKRRIMNDEQQKQMKYNLKEQDLKLENDHSQRTKRTRGVTRSFAEPSLKVKLRR